MRLPGRRKNTKLPAKLAAKDLRLFLKSIDIDLETLDTRESITQMLEVLNNHATTEHIMGKSPEQVVADIIEYLCQVEDMPESVHVLLKTLKIS